MQTNLALGLLTESVDLVRLLKLCKANFSLLWANFDFALVVYGFHDKTVCDVFRDLLKKPADGIAPFCHSGRHLSQRGCPSVPTLASPLSLGHRRDATLFALRQLVSSPQLPYQPSTRRYADSYPFLYRRGRFFSEQK